MSKIVCPLPYACAKLPTIGCVQLQKAVSFLLKFKIVGKSDRTARRVGNLQIYLPNISTRQN